MARNMEGENELEEIEGQIEAIEKEIRYLQSEKQSLCEKRDLIRSQLRSLDDQAQAQSGSRSDTDWEGGSFPWNDHLYSTLLDTFHLKSFRPLQLSCINATLSKHDVILIMPTGGGKSLCYQLPALVSEGFTLVISPLVSLMQDQLRSVEQLGIGSYMLNANSSRTHVNEVHASMIDKNNQSLKLVYVTPEKVSKSKRFISKLEKAHKEGRLARIVIDEVHCASQWGHDFRPDYKILGILKRQFPNTPIMGLTATATVKVLEDCKTLLRLDSCVVFKASYNRPNLFYEIRNKPSSYKEQISDIVDLIQENFAGQSGIVYCFSQKESQEVCTSLNLSGVHAGCYHAGMTPTDRTQTHMNWINNDVQVIVATVAFGMGIDKGNVRFVIHHSISKSIENYYQESGRAGRDGQTAVCVLYYRIADMFRQSTMVQAEYTGLQNLYGMIKYCINQSRCRRYMVAYHFGEVWREADCDKMCDICTRLEGTVEEDVTAICEGFLEVLHDTKLNKQRVTAAKLIDLLKSSNAAKKVAKDKVTGKKLEFVLARCLMDRIVQEDYHFTPYTTISYVVPGPKSYALKSKRLSVKMQTISSFVGLDKLKYPMDRVFEGCSSSSIAPTGSSSTTIHEPVSIPSSSSNLSDDSIANSPCTVITDQLEQSSSSSRPTKRRRSISLGFSEIDEDFIVTPKRRNTKTSVLSTSKSKNKSSSLSVRRSSATKPRLSFLSSSRKLLSNTTSESHVEHCSSDHEDVIEIDSD